MVEALQIPHGGSSVGEWVTLSLGAATARPRVGLRARTLVERADRALYQAKREGRNRVCASGDTPADEPDGEASV